MGRRAEYDSDEFEPDLSVEFDDETPIIYLKRLASYKDRKGRALPRY
jgi:hypothetical protein